jgi:teichuronic acid biosynthesis glycosyltransferase TuaH
LRPTLRPLTAAITQLSPVAPPGANRPGISAITWPLARTQIRWGLRRLGRWPDAFIAAHANDLLGRWGPGVVDVLYGTDDWEAGAGLWGKSASGLRRQTQRALPRADLVLAVGTELVDRWRLYGGDPILFPNGCDVDAYAGIRTVQPGPVPVGFPRPVAGLVGQLSERIDITLLEAVADTGIGLLLVGPRQPRWSPARIDSLLARENVHHVGAVPFSELPQWLARIDVGLTPYADTAFNRASFPLKTLEYLAAGLPVVSTGLPASLALSAETGEVAIADSGAMFAEAARTVAAERPSPDSIARRQAAARRYSWAERASELVRLVAEAGRSGGPEPSDADADAG